MADFRTGYFFPRKDPKRSRRASAMDLPVESAFPFEKCATVASQRSTSMSLGVTDDFRCWLSLAIAFIVGVFWPTLRLVSATDESPIKRLATKIWGTVLIPVDLSRNEMIVDFMALQSWSFNPKWRAIGSVSYTHLRAHET